MTGPTTDDPRVDEAGSRTAALDAPGWTEVLLERKRQAIVALSWFSAAFFAVGLGLTVAQGLRVGYGVINGRLREADRIDVQGTGIFGDAGILVLTVVANLLLMLAWGWIGERVGDDRNEDPARGAVPSGSWYLIDIPRTTRVLLAVAIFCVVAIVITAVLLFPLILIRYGW